jgi:hypothetical protein
LNFLGAETTTNHEQQTTKTTKYLTNSNRQSLNMEEIEEDN